MCFFCDIFVFFFFFNDTATTEIYTLSLHDALPNSPRLMASNGAGSASGVAGSQPRPASARDRKSTRLNSSHDQISYAVFCLKKKKKKKKKKKNEKKKKKKKKERKKKKKK